MKTLIYYYVERRYGSEGIDTDGIVEPKIICISCFITRLIPYVITIESIGLA
mgnify:CR=1 FL=1